MPIICIENLYPPSKSNEVIEAWKTSLQKYPQPEGLCKTLVFGAISPDKNGLNTRSMYLTNPGRYEEAVAYFAKFMTSFFKIEGFTYQLSTWSTIEEAMAAVETPMPET